MAEGRPPVEVELEWDAGLRFRGRAGETSLVIDSDGRAGPSPVQALALALAGCMSVDVVHILEKGRLPLRGLRARLRGERASEDPRRLVRVDLRFTVAGGVPPDKVERAIATFSLARRRPVVRRETKPAGRVCSTPARTA